ncbi:MAG TPA: M13-type metalloendopeptidase [Steroidobacteraceae bacterium]|nr:M13-type metalloendopeptidase [Steroidobacteraceae bacterium]
MLRRTAVTATATISLIAVAVATLAACTSAASKPAPAAQAVAPPPPPPPKSGLDLAGFDRTVRPQDDLYRFVDGGWLAKTEIPADKSNYGSFSILDDRAQDEVRQLIVAASEKANNPPGSDAQKAGDFYLSYLDTARIESLGLTPLAAEIAQIDAIATPRDVARYIGYSMRIGVAQPFVWYTSPDSKNSTVYLASLQQRGLTMPDRDYYLSPDAKFAQFRAKFATYVEQMLARAGERNAKAAAVRIAALETRLANEQWTKVQNRDPVKTYNPMMLPEYQKLTPGFDWLAFYDGLGAPPQKMDVSQPSFFKGVGQLVKTVPVADWRLYFKFHLLNEYAQVLSKDFADLEFDFNQRTIAGVPEQKPRWRQAVELMGDTMGELVGRMFVDAHFKPESKQRVLALVSNLLKAFDTSIDGLEWMSPDTRVEAKRKLSKITVKIGYPDKWRDYSTLTVKRDDLVGNLIRAAEFQHQRYVQRAGGPVDKGEWLMTPQTVNAYYNPTTNEITFPAAILRPPFFDPEADDAVNYGGIGAVIGHEISHGFDDSGRQFDGDGNLRDWWTADDAAKFKTRANGIVAQFNGYTVLDDQHINGELTLGENIGDLSGLAVAFKAYKIALNGQPAPVIDGFTGDQRFFCGWAQGWRRKYRDPELLKRVKADPHAPSEFRTNGPTSNIDAFYDAFGVKSGDRLYRPQNERVKIW